MLLPDHEIAKRAKSKDFISPFNPEHVNPASYDLTLSHLIRVLDQHSPSRHHPIDVREVRRDYTKATKISERDGRTLEPGDFILATSEEVVCVPLDLVARVEGKSSLGRIGLAVHITAGFIDPGFKGQVTLEIANLAPWPIVLRKGMRIAQIAYQRMNSIPAKPYGQTGHYMNQNGPTESRYRMPS